MKWEVIVLDKVEITRVMTFDAETEQEAIKLAQREDWHQWPIEEEYCCYSNIEEVNEVTT